MLETISNIQQKYVQNNVKKTLGARKAKLS